MIAARFPKRGLEGRKNGELLTLAERLGFQVFVTLDRGLEYEQNLRGRIIVVILIRAKSSAWSTYHLIAPKF